MTAGQEAYDPNDAMSSAIGGILGPGNMTTKWVLLTESVDDEGQRLFNAFFQHGVNQWDALGLVHYFLTLTQGDVTRGVIENGLWQ